MYNFLPINVEMYPYVIFSPLLDRIKLVVYLDEEISGPILVKRKQDGREVTMDFSIFIFHALQNTKVFL